MFLLSRSLNWYEKSVAPSCKHHFPIALHLSVLICLVKRKRFYFWQTGLINWAEVGNGLEMKTADLKKYRNLGWQNKKRLHRGGGKDKWFVWRLPEKETEENVCVVVLCGCYCRSLLAPEPFFERVELQKRALCCSDDDRTPWKVKLPKK